MNPSEWIPRPWYGCANPNHDVSFPSDELYLFASGKRVSGFFCEECIEGKFHIRIAGLTDMQTRMRCGDTTFVPKPYYLCGFCCEGPESWLFGVYPPDELFFWEGDADEWDPGFYCHHCLDADEIERGQSLEEVLNAPNRA